MMYFLLQDGGRKNLFPFTLPTKKKINYIPNFNSDEATKHGNLSEPELLLTNNKMRSRKENKNLTQQAGTLLLVQTNKKHSQTI